MIEFMSSENITSAVSAVRDAGGSRRLSTLNKTIRVILEPGEYID